MFEQFSLSHITDNDGVLISAIGYVVVFISLVTLAIIISNFERILQLKQRKKMKNTGHRAANFNDISLSGEVSAAISTALYLHYQEKHDLENTVLTIKRVQKAYSPWSSKLYGLREYPKK